MKQKTLIWLATILIIIGLVGTVMLGVVFGIDSDAFNRGVAYQKSWEFEAEEFQEIRIKSSYDVTIQFTESDSEKSSIQIAGKVEDEVKQRLLQTEIVDHTLDLDLTYQNLFNISVFDFTTANRQSVTISLAKGTTLAALNADLSSSKLIVNDAIAQNINLKTSSGSLRVQRLQGQEIHLASSSGKLEGYDLEGNVRAQASSGDILLKNVTGGLDVTSSSGSIKAFDITGNMKAKANSGNVNITQKEGTLTVKTSSGAVKLTQEKVQETDIQTSSGIVRLQVPKQFAGFYDVQSSSGSVRIPESKRETSEYIKIRTSSGSVRISEE